MKGTVAGVSCIGTRNEGDEEDHEHNNYSNNTSLSQLGPEQYSFHGKHSGKRFCHLSKLVLHFILKLSLLRAKSCDIELLKIDANAPDTDNVGLREQYAKIALLIFYPFRSLCWALLSSSVLFTIPA